MPFEISFEICFWKLERLSIQTMIPEFNGGTFWNFFWKVMIMIGLLSCYILQACLTTSGVCYERGQFVANILLQNVIHSNQANMTGFIFTCEERSVINDTSTCDLTMDFDVSLFEWPESASELQAKLFEVRYNILKTIGFFCCRA